MWDRISYNNEVRAFLNGDDGHLAFALFTDGSARKISRKETCAGWVFTAMGSKQNRDEVPLVEACGPVQTAEGGEHYECAICATNNTAEMQALIEALFRLNSCVAQDDLPSFSNVMMTVDSLHVKELMNDKFLERENRALATLLCHMCKVTKKTLHLHIRRVRGHPGDVGNSIADELADLGAVSIDGGSEFSPMGDWEEDSFQHRCRAYKEKNTV